LDRRLSIIVGRFCHGISQFYCYDGQIVHPKLAWKTLDVKNHSACPGLRFHVISIGTFLVAVPDHLFRKIIKIRARG
jgi:hypothetical protein